MEFVTESFVPVIVGWAVKILLALVVYIVGKWVAKKITSLVRNLMIRAEVDETLINFLANIVYAILLVAVILAALDILGVPVTSLLAVLGAAGLAVGLALKDSLGNFAAGVMLVLFRPFKKGDFVEAAGVSGTVTEVRIFSTILTTPDNKQIMIPNGQVGAATITNYSANDQRRVDLVFGVGYDDDLKVVRGVLEKICERHPMILDDPACKIFVSNLGDSSVDFSVRPWVMSENYWTVYSDLLEQGKIELEAAGCNIPYPQRDLHLHHQNPISELLKG
ncbi:MAG: mechanosensitive ion channel [Gammaproteobacteria bacterium]|jgi:small conductance mechanosensitive channel|nr:mechanosensitive ion channel [Gammaproteobacteria bacterium]